MEPAYLRVGVLRLDVGDDDVDHAGEVDGAGPPVDGLQKPLQQTLTAAAHIRHKHWSLVCPTSTMQ